MSDTLERYYAEMEAERNESESAYFSARSADDTPQARRTFRAGFERAFSQLWHRLRAIKHERDVGCEVAGKALAELHQKCTAPETGACTCSRGNLVGGWDHAIGCPLRSDPPRHELNRGVSHD
jgi:hypothetical protein